MCVSQSLQCHCIHSIFLDIRYTFNERYANIALAKCYIHQMQRNQLVMMVAVDAITVVSSFTIDSH